MELLPSELVINILQNVDAITLSAFGLTCWHNHELSLYESLWARHCQNCEMDQGNAILRNSNMSYRDIYTGLLHKYAWMLGLWQGDQAFFGSLLTIQWDPKNNLIRGALLESSATDYRLRPWAGNHQVMILEQHDHKVTANLSFSIECNPIGHSIPKIDFMGGDLRALKVHFKPCILQPHPDCQLLWNHFTSPDEMDYCLPNQSAFGLCITGPQIRLENNFTKLSSNALFPAAHSDFPTGLFSSFHGGHGMEYVLLEYDPLRESLRAVKMTGDANVPRSEWSWLANVRRPIRQSIDDDFYGALVYQAFGHIAFHGFENESSIQCELFIAGNDSVALYWPQLKQITTYNRCDRDHFKGLLSNADIMSMAMAHG